MLKLKIVNKNNFEYNLIEETGEKYRINIDFLGIEEMPEVGEYIYMRKELLNPKYEGYSTNYIFGNLDDKYGKENILLEDIDVIKIKTEKKEIYLKRLYG